MKVTVLLPVYNAGHLLEGAIRSILRQDFEDFEFVIIDDASKDESAAVISRFANEDRRIKPILHKQNAGLAATLNEGLKAASAPFVARMDQDDESLPSRLRIQYTFMNSRPNVAVAGSFVYHMGISREHDRLVRLPVDAMAIKRLLPVENCMYHPSVMLNRALVLRAGGYRREFRNAEDYDLWLRLSRNHDLANIPVPLIRYHFTVDGMTLGRKWEQLYFVFLAQASFMNPDKAWSAIEQIAKDQHSRLLKADFMTGVLNGTMEELLALGYREQAIRLVERFSTDIGPTATADALAKCSEQTRGPAVRGDDDVLVAFLWSARGTRTISPKI